MSSTQVPVEEEMLSTSPLQSETSPTNNIHIIAFINQASGSGKGGVLLKMLSVELGADNIFIFGRDKPGEVIDRVANEHFDSSIRVIVGGGDGSVNWILSIIHQLNLSERVAVGIIPNGTGNDTSRYLGWGQCQFGDKYTKANVQLMKDPNCPIVDFDRWQLFFSLKKDTMILRTAELRKSGEVPATHTHILNEKKTHLTTQPSPQQSTQAPDNLENEVPLVEPKSSSSASGVDEHRLSLENKKDGTKVEIFLPKFYRSMLRLTELQYTERYKYLHSQHWPQSFDPQQNVILEKMMKILQNNTNENLTLSNSSPQIDQRIIELRQKYSDQLEKQSKWLRFSWSFNNYFSFGIDAQAMNYFGIHRDNNPCCYQCRICTLGWIATCSAATCVCCQKKPLRYRIDILYKEDDLVPIGAAPSKNIVPKPTDCADLMYKTTDRADLSINQDVNIVVEVIPDGSESVQPSDFTQTNDELQYFHDAANLANGYKWLNATFDPLQFDALVLLNIPSYAGGRNIWGTKEQKGEWLSADNQQAQKTDDGALESVAFTGFNQLQFTVLTNSATYRLGQLQGLRLYLENDAFVQLDGEAWIQPRGMVEIYRSAPGKMLKQTNPDYPCC